VYIGRSVALVASLRTGACVSVRSVFGEGARTVRGAHPKAVRRIPIKTIRRIVKRILWNIWQQHIP
jgi:hypothetical protein